MTSNAVQRPQTPGALRVAAVWARLRCCASSTMTRHHLDRRAWHPGPRRSQRDPRDFYHGLLRRGLRRPRQFVWFVVLIFVLSTVGFARDKAKIRQLTPGIHGSTGLFNVYLPDTLRPGEFSLGFHGTKFNREPGDLDFTLFPVSFTAGLYNRIEVFLSYEVHKRVHAGGSLVNKVGPNGPVVPSRISTGSLVWYNDAPFMDVGFGDGAGDLWAGVKLNLLSERRGAPFGFALQPIARFQLTEAREHLLRGLTAGATDAGVDLLLAKNLPGGGSLVGNAGLLLNQDPLNVDRQDRFRYGIGFDLPLGQSSARLIAELVGSTFYNTRGPGLANPRSPLDIYGGLRFFPSKWISISGAYSFYFRPLDGDRYGIPETGRHGFFAQIVLQRKVNRAPTVECKAERTRITEGDFLTIRAYVTDQDDDVLAIIWRTTGGRIIQQDSAVIFDSSMAAPGKYTILGEITDWENTATCSVDVTVEKRRLPAIHEP